MREIIITKRFTFDAAHFLTQYKGKCEALHGHTFSLEVSVKGTPDKEGMVIDYTLLKDIVREAVVDRLDHTCLNDLFDFSPTSENLLLYMADVLEPLLKTSRYRLHNLTLWETANNRASLQFP